MSSVSLPQALDEIDDTKTSIHCSYCLKPVPELMQGQNPCGLCGEFSFDVELVSEERGNKTLLREPRQAVRVRDVKPSIGGIVRRKEYKDQ